MGLGKQVLWMCAEVSLLIPVTKSSSGSTCVIEFQDLGNCRRRRDCREQWSTAGRNRWLPGSFSLHAMSAGAGLGSSSDRVENRIFLFSVILSEGVNAKDRTSCLVIFRSMATKETLECSRFASLWQERFLPPVYLGLCHCNDERLEVCNGDGNIFPLRRDFPRSENAFL